MSNKQRIDEILEQALSFADAEEVPDLDLMDVWVEVLTEAGANRAAGYIQSYLDIEWDMSLDALDEFIDILRSE